MDKRILLVEDEEDTREAVSEFLSEAGFQVTVAKDGEIAMELLRNNLYDMVVLDIMLPKEILLLKLLLEHPNQVLTRDQILDCLWKEEAPMDRVIDVYIKNLRKKLHLDCIVTVKGIGYKYEDRL